MCMIRSRIGWRRVGFLAGGVGEARLLLSTQSEFPEPLAGDLWPAPVGPDEEKFVRDVCRRPT